MAINTYFKNIADAIRSKSGISGALTPGDMPEAILNISAGGVSPITPDIVNLKGVYIAGGFLTYDGNQQNNSYVYFLNQNTKCIALSGSSVGNVFRIGYTPTNPEGFTGNIAINQILNLNEGQSVVETAYNLGVIPANNYLILYKGYQNSEAPTVALYDIYDLIGG